ncbi:MAG: hypothetical protein KF816_11185 [Melioribacteraceae bacterium]|jgi:hypothetical protein|nr:hypothetical protein [Melioribacteraceae bacterium]
MNQLNVAEILTSIGELSNNKISFKDDVEIILNHSIQTDKIDLLKTLAFEAKYSTGLLRVITQKDKIIDEEYFQKMKSEYTESVRKLREKLAVLLIDASPFIKEIFEIKFLEMSQTGMMNLNKLCADLSYVKLYFNDQK